MSEVSPITADSEWLSACAYKPLDKGYVCHWSAHRELATDCVCGGEVPKVWEVLMGQLGDLQAKLTSS